MSRRFIYQIEYLDYRGKPPEIDGDRDTLDSIAEAAIRKLTYTLGIKPDHTIPNASRVQVTLCVDPEDKA